MPRGFSGIDNDLLLVIFHAFHEAKSHKEFVHQRKVTTVDRKVLRFIQQRGFATQLGKARKEKIYTY